MGSHLKNVQIYKFHHKNENNSNLLHKYLNLNKFFQKLKRFKDLKKPYDDLSVVEEHLVKV